MNKPDIYIEIKELIEQNERLVKLAIGNSKIGEEQQTKDLIGFLTHLLEIIYGYRNAKPEKYNSLIQGSFQYENPLKQKEALNNEFYNQINFLDSFRSGLTGIWQQCFISNQYTACQYLVYNVQKILTKISSEDGNEILINQCNLLLQQALSFGIRKHSSHSAFLVGPAFQVYFNVVFNESDDRYRFKLDYLPLFDGWFWGSLVLIINNKAEKVFDSFVETIFQGHYISVLSIGRSYEYFKTLSTHMSEIVDLDRRIFRISNLVEANKVAQEINEKVEKYHSEIREGYSQEQVKYALESMVDKSLKINNLQDYIYLMGAFLVFKKRFDWIKNFWNFKQPIDADAYWGSNEILPETLPSIFAHFLNTSAFQNRLDLVWEKRHGISLYYYQYGILLIARLFFVQRVYIYQDPTNVSNLIRSLNPKDFDSVARICQSLKAQIHIIKQSKLFHEFFKKEGQPHKFSLTDEVNKLLDSITSSASDAKQYDLNSQEFTNQEFQQLLDQSNVNFRKENQIADILENEGCYQILGQKTADIKSLSFSFSRPKSEFIEQWRSIGPSMGFEVARNLSFRLCSGVFRILETKSDLVIHKIEANGFQLNFRKLLRHVLEFEAPFILGFGFNFHSLFWNVEEFNFTQKADQNRVGEYKFGDKIISVYNITNWAPRNSFLIVDAKSFGVLGQIELGENKERRFVEGKREQKNKDQMLVFEFKYESYFKFDFAESPRYIKVIVGDS